ncbi:MAG TPA: tryptophan synthase subunit alpha [Candidatus Polarisedimenticolaceae bacterium]
MSGAERIEAALRAATGSGRLGFVPFLVAGDPDLGRTARYAGALARAGADVLELGVPFSDPLADGPTIQRATERALASGTDLAAVLRALPAIRAAAAVPIVLFGYANPFLRYGVERFVADAAAAGADGVLVTDLPPEEAAPLREPCRARGLATVFLAAPTSTHARLASVCSAASGFVYLVSRAGVTGARTDLAEGVRALVGRVRAHTSLPIAVGFGVSRPEHVTALRGAADAFVVGSALVDRVGAGADEREIESLARSLVEAGRG